LGEIGLWNAEAESWSPECCSGVWNAWAFSVLACYV
jgi:hypothetical protein